MLEVFEKQISQLKPWEDNPRVNDQAVDSVARSIDTFGFNVPILCDQNLTIIAGHTRWKAAKKLSLATVPVIVLKMTDVERQAFALADNKTAEIADWNFPKLREILNELSSEDMDLQDLGFSEPELVALLSDEEEPDWTEFDSRLAALESHSFALLPVKVPPEAKRPIQEALSARAAEIGIDEKDKAVLAGRVIRRLLGVY